MNTKGKKKENQGFREKKLWDAKKKITDLKK